ncbi:MAG: FecR family protein [Pseudodesulfovibrio sp.]
MAKVSNHAFKFSIVTIILLSFIFIATLASAASMADEAIGEVVYLAGTVRAQQPNAAARQLTLESVVFARDTLTTSQYSKVEIRFKDGTILAQGQSGEISLDNYVYSTNASASKLLFKMSLGTFRIVTGEIVKLNPEAFKLETQITTLGIRGTQPFIKIEKDVETIGVIELTPGYTVTATTAKQSITFDKAGFFTSIDRDGGMSQPTPTPPAVQRAIQQAAPMTSLGEHGARGSKEDMQRKVKTFEKHIVREKEDLGEHSDTGNKPSYGKIHQISVHTKGLKNAENERDGKGSSSTSGTLIGGDHHDDDHHDDGHGDGGGDH